MREHRGYPIALGGAVKYVAPRLRSGRSNSPLPAALDAMRVDPPPAVPHAVETLAARLELAILQKSRPKNGDGAEAALRQAIAEDAQFFSALMAFRSDDATGVVEFEFGAFGHPGLYAKRVRLGGLVGEFPTVRMRFEHEDDEDDEEPM